MTITKTQYGSRFTDVNVNESAGIWVCSMDSHDLVFKSPGKVHGR